MRLAYHLLNVFTRDGAPLSGNPLCVFEPAPGLDGERMQALALQFNLSETTFLAPSARASAAVRIFTPSYEMAFAGHPTLGTAAVVHRLQGGDALTLEMQAGVIPVERDGACWTLTAKSCSSRGCALDAASLARALGLTPRDLAGAARFVDSGTEQLIVPVADASVVARARPDGGAFEALANAAGVSQALVFSAEQARVPGGTIVARFFFDAAGNIREDPATGSACANLGGWFLEERGTVLPFARTIDQGDAVQRPASLHLRIDAARRVLVRGEVVHLGRGELTL